ncbi:MAG: outer membrane protein assembly factor BamE [Woeseiaceae bacterium]|nr:outer membrane protein assembly factor BamE [Woeseiaceae bacterium]
MRKIFSIAVIFAVVSLASACVYQATLSQGNLLDQEDVDQLAVGMTRTQVRFLLGTPMIDDPFHDDRWDYVYYLRVGRDKAIFKRWVSVFFEDEVVSEVIRDQELRPDL